MSTDLRQQAMLQPPAIVMDLAADEEQQQQGPAAGQPVSAEPKVDGKTIRKYEKKMTFVFFALPIHDP